LGCGWIGLLFIPIFQWNYNEKLKNTNLSFTWFFNKIVLHCLFFQEFCVSVSYCLIYISKPCILSCMARAMFTLNQLANRFSLSKIYFSLAFLTFSWIVRNRTFHSVFLVVTKRVLCFIHWMWPENSTLHSKCINFFYVFYIFVFISTSMLKLFMLDCVKALTATHTNYNFRRKIKNFFHSESAFACKWFARSNLPNHIVVSRVKIVQIERKAHLYSPKRKIMKIFNFHAVSSFSVSTPHWIVHDESGKFCDYLVSQRKRLWIDSKNRINS
jgi:hypothetical protein